MYNNFVNIYIIVMVCLIFVFVSGLIVVCVVMKWFNFMMIMVRMDVVIEKFIEK